ncbi:PilW family protein [Ahniella affigens]|nr:prepilin-type N-terminal cleavage/methylation domain-containing protein [Ahniella affigens]
MSRRPTGFTLTELMVALTLGLLVIGSATALLVATLDANGRNIRATRLTQEIRAISDVVSAELRRARYHPDALLNLGENGDDDDGDGRVTRLDNIFATNPFETIRVSGQGQIDDGDATTIDGSCIQFAYGAANGDAFHTISLVQIGDRGVVRMNRQANSFPACGTGANLSSAQVDIDVLAFNFDAADSQTDPDYDTIRVSIRGRLVGDPDTRRQFVESIRLRAPIMPPAPVLPPERLARN